ncbi:MAG: hypothetical protein VX777_07990 [Chlamydiota bacterium]|nr:hypothetical protein [Chlamydiota bacterium]
MRPVFDAAVAFDNVGNPIINEKEEIKDGYVVKSSKSQIRTDYTTNPREIVYGFKSVTAVVPCSKVSMSSDWKAYVDGIFNNQVLDSGYESLKNLNITVDSYSVRETAVIRFLFREVFGNSIQVVRKFLDQPLPSQEKVDCYIQNLIEPVLNGIENINPKASMTKIGLTTAYYLPIGETLKVVLRGNRVSRFQACIKPLVFIYPLHPAVEDATVVETVNLIKNSVENIDIKFIDSTPVQVIEPKFVLNINYV